MTKLGMILAAASLVACTTQDNKSIEQRLDRIEALLKNGAGAAGGRAGAAAQRPQRPEPDKAKTYAMPIEGDPVDGPADAKVTLVKAYDYACPFCERVRGPMEELRKKYGNELRIVYKQFVVHPQVATASALAVCAADRQHKFMEMDKLLWDKGYKDKQFDKDGPAEAGGAPSKCWEKAEGCAVVNGFASELGLDLAQFKSDMKGACMQLIQKDMKDVQQLGVGATPAFFINGRYLSGAMPTENFAALIDEELKKANEKIQSGVPQAEFYKQEILGKGLKSLQ